MSARLDERKAMDFREMFRKFFLNYAQEELRIRTSGDEVLRLRREDPNVWELAENAIEFRCGGKWHSRAAFVNLMKRRMQPGHAFHIALTE
jgi:hypothetical protein